MQLGGAFSYTPKPYDLSKRRTGLARFLRDDLGLYGETFAKERAALAERQARDITAALPGYDKYAGTGGARYTQTQAAFDFGAKDLRTAAELRAERRDIAQTDKAEFDLEQAKVAAKEREELYKLNKDNAWLQNQINKGTLSDQEVERKKKAALAVIRGDAQMQAVAKAQESYNKNPSPETARELRFARSDYSSQQTAANFYKNVSDEVSRLKALDPKFTSKKREGIVKGASTDVTGYTGEQAAAAEEKLWRQASARMYMTMKSTYADTVDLSPFYLHMKPKDINTMTGLADSIRSGFDKLGVDKTEGEVTLDVISAGIEGSPEAKEQKLKEFIRFAAEAGIPIRDNKGSNVAVRKEEKPKVTPRDLPPISEKIDVAAEPKTPIKPLDRGTAGKEIEKLTNANNNVFSKIAQDRNLLERLSSTAPEGSPERRNYEMLYQRIQDNNEVIKRNIDAIEKLKRRAGIR